MLWVAQRETGLTTPVRGNDIGGWSLSLRRTAEKGLSVRRSFLPCTRVACLLVVETACTRVLGRKTVRPTHELGVWEHRRAADLWSLHRTPQGDVAPDT